VILRLDRLSFAEVRFEATLCDYSRFVTVQVGSGRDRPTAVRFPNLRSDEGYSLGAGDLDNEVRIRAAEELVRLDAAIAIASGRATA
jgi:hypothetical protein